MTRHLICLTIDTDPDGLNTHTPDRGNLAWDGLNFAMSEFHAALNDMPLTWYVRADAQLERAYGSVRYLLDAHADFWTAAIARGDELGWHPHLYTPDPAPRLIRDSHTAVTELKRIHANMADVSFDLPTFRMGEAWHTSQTLRTVYELGYTVDSTAIPNRDDSASGHPRNWAGTPNHPYYPAWDAIRTPGDQRNLLEIPMNSWYVQASYDAAPKLRYMNPCIHADLWSQAMDKLFASLTFADLHIWNMILHPAEAMPHAKPDMLYSYSLATLRDNLHKFAERLASYNHAVEFTTVYRAAQQWFSES